MTANKYYKEETVMIPLLKSLKLGVGKALTMATDILESAPWSMVKMVTLWSIKTYIVCVAKIYLNLNCKIVD